MFESNICKLCQMKLKYTCISKLVVSVKKVSGAALTDDLKYYLDSNNFSRVFYHQRSTNTDKRIKPLLVGLEKLLALCNSGYHGSLLL